MDRVKHLRRDRDGQKALSGDLFIGQVRAQQLTANDHFRVQEVLFVDGARTKWHTHSFPQVLVVTDGAGVVATDDEEVHVHSGDVLDIAPGVRHWHGAEPRQNMAHLSVNGIGDTSW